MKRQAWLQARVLHDLEVNEEEKLFVFLVVMTGSATKSSPGEKGSKEAILRVSVRWCSHPDPAVVACPDGLSQRTAPFFPPSRSSANVWLLPVTWRMQPFGCC